MGHIMKSFVFLAFTLSLASAAKHSMQYFYTGVTPGINFPEFTLVGLVDGEQFVYYDSNIRQRIPKTEWIKKVDRTDPGYWEKNPQKHLGTQETYKANVEILMKRFNQSGGVHTYQTMYGCELNDDGTPHGYFQYGYDGEDFVSLDLSTVTWTAPTPEAVVTKHKWERLGVAAQQKNYLENICIDWLKKYVEYGRSTLERKVPPGGVVFQKDSSSPVVCHATGFFPKEVMISWQKNGEDLYEDVDLRETQVNEDGTFQKKSVLTVSPEELDRDKYTCVIQHAGLKKDMVLQMSDRRVLKGVPGGVPVAVIIGVVAVLLLIVVGGVGFFVWKKKSGFKPVSQTPSEDSASDKS
ncbi:RLA class I histocompatibility antigen, alpha chain 11/11-like [Hoplias malabaricus]|uniref:RLA class I histocompatibility antigen, alpha chain 11/11-like n=1 Tax=Hoplias malabaricus TaxID=27720 RepID=UPI00346263C9